MVKKAQYFTKTQRVEVWSMQQQKHAAHIE